MVALRARRDPLLLVPADLERHCALLRAFGHKLVRALAPQDAPLVFELR